MYFGEEILPYVAEEEHPFFKLILETEIDVGQSRLDKASRLFAEIKKKAEIANKLSWQCAYTLLVAGYHYELDQLDDTLELVTELNLKLVKALVNQPDDKQLSICQYFVELLKVKTYWLQNIHVLKYNSLMKARDIAKRLDWEYGLIWTKTTMALFYHEMGDFERARKEYQLVEVVMLRGKYEGLYDRLYNNAALNFHFQKDFKNASAYYSKALHFANEFAPGATQIRILCNHAQMLLMEMERTKENESKALGLLQQADAVLSNHPAIDVRESVHRLRLVRCWCYYYQYHHKPQKVIELLEKEMDVLPSSVIELAIWAYNEIGDKQNTFDAFIRYKNYVLDRHMNKATEMGAYDVIFQKAKAEAESEFQRELWEQEKQHNEALLREQKKVELKSLVKQMNPHFMFNSLNSISHFVQENDQATANNYLSRYSRLMRQTLNYSHADRIALEDEIEILTIYLELEALRFGGLFDFQLELKNLEDLTGLGVPPMLIQPHVENAVWHGLRRRKQSEGGKLMLKFELLENTLFCEVVDNGVGREEASKYNKLDRKQHKSVGKSNMERRIELINSLEERPIKLKITNNPDGNTVGTCVRLEFPV